jgi:hypothetical protein
MHFLRSQTKFPVAKAIAHAWDHFKDVRVATKPEERKWFVPEPVISWEAESLADLKANIGKVELNDKVHLQKARWWPVREGEYRVKLKDDGAELEINLDRNPFYGDQSGIVPPGNIFEHQVDVPRVLLAALTDARAGCEIYDIELLMRLALPGKARKPRHDDLIEPGFWVTPNADPSSSRITDIELRVWDVHLNPGERRGYNPIRGFRSLAAHPEVDEKALK